MVPNHRLAYGAKFIIPVGASGSNRIARIAICRKSNALCCDPRQHASIRICFEEVGRKVSSALAAFGDFSVFCGRVFAWIFTGWFRLKNLRLLLPQFYEVGTKSVPVVGVVGAFIGMVMAVETYQQFRALGQENRLGEVITLSVVKQIGPVLAAVMVALAGVGWIAHSGTGQS